MKVIFKKPIVEQILVLEREAKLQNKQIDYIELTRQEAIMLYDETNNLACWYPWKLTLILSDEEKIKNINGALVCGIKIKVNNVEGKYAS